MSERIQNLRRDAANVPALRRYARDPMLSDMDFMREFWRISGGSTNEAFGDFVQRYGYEGPVGSGFDAFADSALLGFYDELGAAFDSALTDQSYEEALDERRAGLAAYRELYPERAMGASMAGFVLPGGALLKGLSRANVATSGVRSLAGQGAGLGGAYGFGSGEGGFLNRTGRAGQDALLGGAFGAGFGLAGKGIMGGARAMQSGAQAVDDFFRTGGPSRTAGAVGDAGRNMWRAFRGGGPPDEPPPPPSPSPSGGTPGPFGNVPPRPPGSPPVAPDVPGATPGAPLDMGPSPWDDVGAGALGAGVNAAARAAGAPRMVAGPLGRMGRVFAEKAARLLRREPAPAVPEATPVRPEVAFPPPRPRGDAVPSLVNEAKALFDDVYNYLGDNPAQFADARTAKLFDDRMLQLAGAMDILDSGDLLTAIRKYKGLQLAADATEQDAYMALLDFMDRAAANGSLEDRALRLMFSTTRNHRDVARAMMALDEMDRSFQLFQRLGSAGDNVDPFNVADIVQPEGTLRSRVEALLTSRLDDLEKKGTIKSRDERRAFLESIPHPGDDTQWALIRNGGDLGNPKRQRFRLPKAWRDARKASVVRARAEMAAERRTRRQTSQVSEAAPPAPPEGTAPEVTSVASPRAQSASPVSPDISGFVEGPPVGLPGFPGDLPPPMRPPTPSGSVPAVLSPDELMQLADRAIQAQAMGGRMADVIDPMHPQATQVRQLVVQRGPTWGGAGMRRGMVSAGRDLPDSPIVPGHTEAGVRVPRGMSMRDRLDTSGEVYDHIFNWQDPLVDRPMSGTNVRGLGAGSSPEGSLPADMLAQGTDVRAAAVAQRPSLLRRVRRVAKLRDLAAEEIQNYGVDPRQARRTAEVALRAADQFVKQDNAAALEILAELTDDGLRQRATDYAMDLATRVQQRAQGQAVSMGAFGEELKCGSRGDRRCDRGSR